MANIEKRINQDQKISYRVKVRLKGFPAQTATFERLTDAKRWVHNKPSQLSEKVATLKLPKPNGAH